MLVCKNVHYSCFQQTRLVLILSPSHLHPVCLGHGCTFLSDTVVYTCHTEFVWAVCICFPELSMTFFVLPFLGINDLFLCWQFLSPLLLRRLTSTQFLSTVNHIVYGCCVKGVFVCWIVTNGKLPEGKQYIWNIAKTTSRHVHVREY